LQESWSKGSHAARELATVFSVSLFYSSNSWPIGQNTPLPTEGVSAHHWINYVTISIDAKICKNTTASNYFSECYLIYPII